MIQFDVDIKAKLDFLSLDNALVNQKIESYFNSEFVVEFNEKIYSFCFLKSNILLLEIIDGVIHHVYSKKYDEIITDDFLNEFLNSKKLPTRVHRYKKIGVDRLRLQIADELFIGEFITKDNCVLWEKYNLKFLITHNLKLVCQ